MFADLLQNVKKRTKNVVTNPLSLPYLLPDNSVNKVHRFLFIFNFFAQDIEQVLTIYTNCSIFVKFCMFKYSTKMFKIHLIKQHCMVT